MPRFYCDYCDAYLTHDSMTGRQQHMRGNLLSLLSTSSSLKIILEQAGSIVKISGITTSLCTLHGSKSSKRYRCIRCNNSK